MNQALDEEFREFMHGRWAAMVRLAYGLTGDRGYAEDVAQTAFAKAYAAWPRVIRTGDPDAYVRRIVINENHNRFRKRRIAERLTDRPPEQNQHKIRGVEDREALIAALAALGPRQRAVVVLRYWLDLSEADIAAALNCSVGTVKSQASRALATLRKSAELLEEDFR
ncbi:MAG TPA: SigE family RNA polymerase sigma factor [Streptosporangiaceae bacterium]